MKIEPTMQPTPDRIRAIRTSRSLTQSQLAAMLNVSFVTISRWETGYSKPSDLAWQQILKIEESKIGSQAGPKSSGSPAAQITDFLADPERVQVFVEGERLEFGHLYNPAFATEISLIDPLPHHASQFTNGCSLRAAYGSCWPMMPAPAKRS